jgi:broad specificity polyphosphatase/5'/3'-nucleotidase SurE
MPHLAMTYIILTIATALLIFAGQFTHAVLRTSAVQAIAKGRPWMVMGLNAAANLVRLLVLSGGVAAVMDGNWLNVAAVVVGQAAGDWVSMRLGSMAVAS